MPYFSKRVPQFVLGAIILLISLAQAQAQPSTGSFAGRQYAAVQTSGGAGAEQYLWIDSDRNKNSYILTLSRGQARFGSVSFTLPANKEEYGLLKLDTSGNTVWYRRLRRLDINKQRGLYGAALHTDADGNSFLAVKNSTNDSVGGLTMSLPPGRHAFSVTKYDANGNQLWANWVAQGDSPADSIPSLFLWPGRSITILSTGEIAVCGSFYRAGSGYFPGATFSTRANRPFVAKLNASGATTKTLLGYNAGRGENKIAAIASSGTRLYMCGYKTSDTLSFPGTGGNTQTMIQSEQGGNAMFMAELDAATLTVRRLEARREYIYEESWGNQSQYFEFDLAARSDSGVYALGSIYGRKEITDPTTGSTTGDGWHESRVYGMFGAPALPYNGAIVRQPGRIKRANTPFGNVVVDVQSIYSVHGLEIQADNSLLLHGMTQVDQDTALSFPMNPQLDRLRNYNNWSITKMGPQGQYLGTFHSSDATCISALPTLDRFVQAGTYQVATDNLTPFNPLQQPSGAAGFNGYWGRYGALPTGCVSSVLLSANTASPGDEVEVFASYLNYTYELHLNGKPVPFRPAGTPTGDTKLIFTVPADATTGMVQPLLLDTTRCAIPALLQISPPAEVRMSASARSICGGRYTDPQGAGINYANNQYFTQTLTPSTAGAKLQLDFTLVQLSDNDQLYVYNGPSASSPLLFRSVGGSVAPGRLVSTHASGALTVRFYSNGTGQAEGFEAVASCQTAASPMPSITGMSKTSGVNGETVTLTGTNLGGTLWLRFGKTLTEGFTIRNSQTLDVVVPNGAETGYISAFMANGVASAVAVSPRVFTIMDTIRQFPGQTFTKCHGFFTDAQGSNANYRPNQYQTIILWPGISDLGIVLKFSQFDIGPGDQFYVFNGPTTAYPLLYRYVGGSGAVALDSIRAINDGGALMVRFYSDAVGEGAGWMASLSCRPMAGPSPANTRRGVDGIGDDGITVETFAFWPNPTRGKLTVRAENLQANALFLYDAQGKAVYTSGIQDGVTDLTLPKLPAGLYMLRCGRHMARLAVE